MSKIHNDPCDSNIDEQKDREMLRSAIISELDAINLYEQMSAQSLSNIVKNLFLDIAREEKVHKGEFETLLEELDSDYVETKEDGEEEVEDIIV